MAPCFLSNYQKNKAISLNSVTMLSSAIKRYPKTKKWQTFLSNFGQMTEMSQRKKKTTRMVKF